jgi:hypothetical protein
MRPCQPARAGRPGDLRLFKEGGMRFIVICSVAALLLCASTARAQLTSGQVDFNGPAALSAAFLDPSTCTTRVSPADRLWAEIWTDRADGPGPVRLVPDRLARDEADHSQAHRRPRAVEYSEAYGTRLKIHRYASFAMLPLFVADYVVGEKLYTNPRGGGRDAHSAMAVGIAGLFGLNTVTGVWNMREAWKDPNGRTRRVLHGMLMLIADGGFVATAALAPHEEGERFRSGGVAPGSGRTTHRAVALSSMGIATVSYLMMYLWRP